MATDIANFVSRNFRGPNVAAVDSARYQNALARNRVERLPQQNRSDDLAIQQQEQSVNAGQVENAMGILDRQLAAIEASPQAKATAMQITSTPDWQQLTGFLKLPPIQIDDTDTDDGLRTQAQQLRQALRGASQQQRVQSTQVLEDGTIAYMTSDGQLVRTGERARNDLRFVDAGGGTGAFDPRTGQVAPITTAQQETDAAAEKAGAEAWARAAATAGVDLQKEQVGRQATLGVWRVARQGLLAGLQGTNTGPVAGRMPAVTAGQQIAEGGVAAVAPVLKALFRSAGEGVFTDRDQELLLAMIPSRTDHPETINAKMQMIDAIIEAKLTGQPGGGRTGGPQVGEVQDGYQFIGGDPSQQTSWRKVN